MEEAVVGATIKVLLQNLISVSMKEFKLIRDFRKDMEKLRSTLVTIQEFVYDAETLQQTNKPVKRWLKKLEDVAFQAYYVLDELDYLTLRNSRLKMETTKTTFKQRIKSKASNFNDRRKLGHKIRDINKDFESINREASGLGLPTRLAGLQATGVASPASASQETDSFTFDPILLVNSLQKVRDKEEAKSACIFQKPNIVELVLLWNEPKEGETNYENVLEGLQPHPNLKKLEISGFKGTRFPSWALKMAVQDEDHWKRLNNLMEIRLTNCSECEEIPIMGHLPSLKSLFLGGLTNVRSIGSTFYGIDHCNGYCKDTVIVFPALERLELIYMPNMTEWVEVEVAESQTRQVKVFPCLEYLKIRECNKLRGAPSHFPCLKKLEIEGMDSGLALANICGTKLTSLTRLDIREIQELESLPHGLFYNNQHLQELDIRGCPRLRELADGLHTLNSLQELTIQSCPSLESIPDCSSGSFTSLRWLVIRDCPELMNLSCEMVESSAPSLKRLELRGLRSVMNMQMIIDCLGKMQCLEYLDLHLPKFITTSSTHTPPSFRSLRELRMSPDSDSWDCVSFKEAVDGILMRFGSNSLRQVELSGNEDWELLPDQLQHLSSIVILYLSNFGIQQLPQWFGNLSSLEQLFLRNCKRLRSLPSVEAMPRLTNLSYLYIYDCPLLKERCIEQKSDDHDSQWPNISHIPKIRVDGNRLK
ncbi:hypothetical protein ACS0TY_026533 [Phlomoides rotata]